MITLELSREEARQLKHCIDVYVSMTRDEEVRTDDREFRQELLKTIGTLREVSRRLDASLSTESRSGEDVAA